jgi:hypothetical protein
MEVLAGLPGLIEVGRQSSIEDRLGLEKVGV